MPMFSHCPQETEDPVNGCRGCPTEHFHEGRKSPECAAVFCETADERRARRKREHPELCFHCNPEGAQCACAF